MWVLRIEPQSSARAMNALKHWAMSPNPPLFFCPSKYTIYWVQLVLPVHGCGAIHRWPTSKNWLPLPYLKPIRKAPWLGKWPQETLPHSLWTFTQLDLILVITVPMSYCVNSQVMSKRRYFTALVPSSACPFFLPYFYGALWTLGFFWEGLIWWLIYAWTVIVTYFQSLYKLWVSALTNAHSKKEASLTKAERSPSLCEST